MSDQLIGKTLSDKYKIEDVLRDNGTGRVYRGTHLLMEKPITLKILPPAMAANENLVRSFSAEARTLSLVSHPNILNVTDFGSDKNGAIYIALENADGETVKDAIQREGKFTPERAVRVARQIAAALAAAHAGNVFHGHLSSENIFLTEAANEPETVKVLNFGASNVSENNLNGEKITANDVEYLAPEQLSGTAKADSRSDIYSLGVILYEMLAGEVPYYGETSAEIIKRQAQEPPAPLSAFRNDLPVFIEPIVLQSLAKNPEMRFQTANEFARVLNHVEENFSESQTIIVPEADVEINNNIWKTAFIVLAGIVFFGAVFAYTTAVKQTDPVTTLPTDANGMPVQPLNPATGASEQSLSNMMSFSPEMMAGNSNMTAVPGGAGSAAMYPDGVNPWASGRTPAGAPPPYPAAPGGQMIDPNNPNSPFMQDGMVYVPVPVNPNANANANVKPAPTTTPAVKTTPATANPQASPTPNNTTAPPAANTKPTPAPKTDKTPAKPAEKPKASPPASTEKNTQSGQTQDS